MIHFSECFYKHALCLEILFSPISLKIDCFTYLSNQCIYNMPRSVVGYREKYRLPINTMPKKMANIWKGNMQNFFMYFLVGRNATFNLPKMPIFFLYDWFNHRLLDIDNYKQTSCRIKIHLLFSVFDYLFLYFKWGTKITEKQIMIWYYVLAINSL